MYGQNVHTSNPRNPKLTRWTVSKPTHQYPLPPQKRIRFRQHVNRTIPRCPDVGVVCNERKYVLGFPFFWALRTNTGVPFRSSQIRVDPLGDFLTAELFLA
mmetsp:Transcript_61671/g.74196  ORF Transcript_61671/g.74196 Transcript_61671/m.74196 type:complete len:101 (+) Transcript_61671:49-351(+)